MGSNAKPWPATAPKAGKAGCIGDIGVIQGFYRVSRVYRDNGKANGNYYLGFRV